MKAGNLQYSTAATGSTVTVSDTGDDIVVIHETVLVATLTLALPATPQDGQRVNFTSVGGVTALTMTTPVGTIVGAVTTLGVGGAITYIYRGSTTKWYRIQ